MYSITGGIDALKAARDKQMAETKTVTPPPYLENIKSMGLKPDKISNIIKSAAQRG